MDLIHDIHPVSDLKRNTASLVGQVVETKRPVLITQGGRSIVMLVEVEEYQKQLRKIKLLEAIAKGQNEIQEGKGIPHKAVLKKLGKWAKNSK